MTTLLYIRKYAEYENGEYEYESGEYENMGHYIQLNINTLSGKTFKLRVLTGCAEKELSDWNCTCACIKNCIKKHYEAEILAIPRTEKEEDDFWAVWGHVSGRNDLNEIEPYEQNQPKTDLQK